MLKKKRAQSTLEYAVIIAVVITALLAIQIYMKRGVQGKLRESTDQIGEQFEAEDTGVTSTTIRTGSNTTQTVTGTTSTYKTYEKQKTLGSESVSGWDSE